MLGLPKNTELRKVIPKKLLFTKFAMNTAEQKQFDSVIRQIVITNEISSRTIPVLSDENDNKAIYVLHVQLKQEACEDKIINKLLTLIEQRIVLALYYEGKIQLALYNNRLIKSDFQAEEQVRVELRGMKLHDVWDNMSLQLANICAKEGQSAKEALINSVELEKLEKDIGALTKKMWSEKQPNKKLALRQKIKALKNKMEEL